MNLIIYIFLIYKIINYCDYKYQHNIIIYLLFKLFLKKFVKEKVLNYYFRNTISYFIFFKND